MKQFIDYVGMLHDLSLIDDYLHRLATPLNNNDRYRNLNFDGVSRYVNRDSKISTNPQSKYHYPLVEYIRRASKVCDPHGHKLELLASEKLDGYTAGLQMTNLDFLALVRSVKSSDCIEYYKHHGMMLKLSEVEGELARTTCKNLYRMVLSIGENESQPFVSNLLNANGMIRQGDGHHTVFINKHDVNVYIYGENNIAINVNNDLRVLHMAKRFAKVAEVFAEFPSDRLGYERT